MEFTERASKPKAERDGEDSEQVGEQEDLGKRKKEMIRLTLKWASETFTLQLELSETVEDLKSVIELETGVRPENQKLFGLKFKGKAKIPDGATIEELECGQVIKMMGSVDETIDSVEAALATAAGHSVLDDFDIDFTLDLESHVHFADAQLALAQTVRETDINLITPPRHGKKLLVLDLDHTLLDFSSRHTSNMDELKRPYMDDFLTACYKHYDLVVWSQTKWHWVEIKLTEMGMITHPSYSICFALDRSCMFKVTTDYKGEKRRHEVKALDIIWQKFPEKWGPHNTLHIDDLARNFALNPKNGLKCSAYKRKRSRAAQDCELLEIAAYLESIAERHDDFSKLDHGRWRDHLSKLVQKQL